ncbi:putative Na(+)/H(+) antiporter C3A11.09 [Hypsizygus marmoreus]|uniref:Na(+)/H(+) antiporter C3A11.09 n=1 Tax=Hypsizygus marmoreus TaxID=39966 RepID=A0A369J5J1_HYPMA|nr:putative Na(+)/H(+) antiporter C3A11.09 [Hypsizygus marmoreus]
MTEIIEVTAPGLAYICLGGFVVAFSMFSLLVKERLYINEVVLGTAFGVIVGPHVANAFDPRTWGTSTNFITLEIMRIVLAVGLFAIGVELPRSYMAKHAKSLLTMVVPTMAIGWAVVAGILYGLFPKLSFISCLAIASCLTPTDPIICASIVGGRYAKKHVPLNLRHILSAESAANDGLAFPFLTISLYLLLDTTRREAITHWVLIGWLYQVIFGVVAGAILGLAFSYVMKFSHKRGYIDRESYVAQYLALAIFVTGIVSTIGSDDLLAAFAAGSAISWDGDFNDNTEGEVFASVIDLVLNCACFVYIGAWLPFESFNSPELGIVSWRLVVLFLCILILRRIPAILALYKWIPEIRTWREALFSGHFGPVSFLVSYTAALHKLPNPHNPPQNEEEFLAACLQPIVAFVVLGSIIIHGLSIPFFSLGKSTISLSNTLTSRSSNKTPDWLIGIRHTSALQTPLTAPREDTSLTGVVTPPAPDTSKPDVVIRTRPVTPDAVEEVLIQPKAVHFPAAQ